MVLYLGDGKYLHTAYAVSNIAEEFTADDWSLTTQNGMGFIGTYIDDVATDSNDPLDYKWEEFVDEDVDDIDEDGEMPVADFQAQIDALQDQVSVLQDDTSDLQTSIDVNAENVSGAVDIASESQAIAEATNQHFWNQDDASYFPSTDTTVDETKTYYTFDGTSYTAVTPTGTEDPSSEGWFEILGAGAYVTEEPQESFKEAPTGKNSLWNSLGMLFRNGLNNLLSIMAGGTSGTGEKGIAVYDGNGNTTDNIVAKFTNQIVRIGKETADHVDINTDGVTIRESDAVFPYTRLKSSTLEMIEIPETHGLSITPDEIAFPYDVTSGKSYITSRQFRLGISTGISGSASILGRFGDAESDDILTLVWSTNIQQRNMYYIRMKNNGNINISGQYQHKGNPLFKVVTGITGTLNSAIASGSRGDVVASYTLPSGYNRVLGVRAIDSNHQTALVLTSYDVSGDGTDGATVSLTARFRNVTSSSVASGTTATWEICIGYY